ncbi:DUF2225 domain-containing protein [bacterium]|nr:DUF2225 domain-containing protein [bacterium]MBP9806910.1 DUF2225 domain-containing protein [bacterium]
MYLADIGVKCPNCGVKFNSKQLPEVVDTGLRNSELRQHVGDVRPQYEQYLILTCPSCGKSAWATEFAATSEVCVLNQPNKPPHLQYRNAAIWAEREGGNFFRVAMYYLYAAWCADDVNAVPQAREYRRLATEAFRKCLVDVSCPNSSRADVEYLIGELCRRTGDFARCKEYFQAVIGRLPALYSTMARKLMKLAEMGSEDLIDFEGIN